MKKGNRGIDAASVSATPLTQKEALISVKGGGANVTHVRDLRGTVEREQAAIGVLLCMEDPTKPMLREAADAGFYTSPAGTQQPKLQILTVEQLLNGQRLNLPVWHDVRTFKKAPKATGAKRKDAELF